MYVVDLNPVKVEILFLENLRLNKNKITTNIKKTTEREIVATFIQNETEAKKI